MSRMGEWWMEWSEDDDLDLMLAALAHEEELHQRQLEEKQCPHPPGLLTPTTLQLKSSVSTSSLKAGQVTEMTPTGSWQPKKS